MKKKIFCFVVISLVVFSVLCVPCFALTNVPLGYTGLGLSSDSYRINAPSRIIFKGDYDLSNVDESIKYSSVVEIPLLVNRTEEQYGLEMNGRKYFYRWGNFLTTSTYSSDVTLPDRISDVNGYSRYIINGAPTDTDFYSTPSTLYPGGSLHDEFGNVVASNQTDLNLIRNGCTYTFSELFIHFDNYYYDPSVVESPTSFNLQWYIVIPKLDTAIPTKLQKIIDDYVVTKSLQGGISTYNDEGRPVQIQVTVPCEVSSYTTVDSGFNDGYSILIVNTVYKYEEAINSVLRERNPHIQNYLSYYPGVYLTMATPTANIGGVSNMGLHPYYVCSISTYVGDNPQVSTISQFRVINIDNDTSGILDWLVNVVSGFFNIEFFGFFSLGDLFGILIAIGVVMLILKIFAGG